MADKIARPTISHASPAPFVLGDSKLCILNGDKGELVEGVQCILYQIDQLNTVMARKMNRKESMAIQHSIDALMALAACYLTGSCAAAGTFTSVVEG